MRGLYQLFTEALSYQPHTYRKDSNGAPVPVFTREAWEKRIQTMASNLIKKFPNRYTMEDAMTAAKVFCDTELEQGLSFVEG